MTHPRFTKHPYHASDMTMKRRVLILLAAFFTVLPPASAGAQVGSCTTGLAEATLSANNVRARIFNTGNLFRRSGTQNVYTVPGAAGVNAIFNAGLWMGGRVGNTLRVAGSTYGPYEFWPGPVSAVTAGQDCGVYDRIYRVARRDLAALDAGESPGTDVLEWPWEIGAPVVDGDGNPDNYDLAAGDRPEVLGDESLFWIMNDVGNVHTRTGSPPLGVEIHVTAFAAASTNPDIDNATFYRYRIFSRNSLPIEDAYVGIYSDTDLGYFADDFVGSAPALNLAYSYNADNDDETIGQTPGYGAAPPAIGYQILGGPDAGADGLDNDNDGFVDEPGEQIGMSSFVYYNSGGGVQGDPGTGQDMYNYMRPRWRDGVPITFGGDGRNFSNTPTNFMFPDTPPAYWSEVNSDDLGTPNTPADRRFVAGIGPFSLQPGESTDVFVGTLWARGTDNLDSVSELLGVASRLNGSTPQDITGNLPVTAIETPEPTVPGDMASGQPLDVSLEWLFNSGVDVQFEVQLADNDGFVGATTLISESTGLDLNGFLQSDKNYVWRVRAFNPLAYSPWSGTFSFSTGTASFANLSVFEGFSVVANSGGPLVPPDMAAFAFNSSGFPGIPCPLDPTTLCDRPLRGYQQALTNAVWGIHTGGNGSRAPYDSFLQRVLRNGLNNPMPFDYEIRFTGTSLHYDRFGVTGGGIRTADPLPFELWNTGIGTPNDTADDFRLVVVGIDWNLDGWGIQNVDHEISAGTNDPQTDWFYMYEPLDTSPGTAGYDAWAAGALIDPELNLGREVIGRLVFVNWNGGNTLDLPPVYDAQLPEPGTIFRIETSLFPAPLLASPANDGYVTPGNVSFSWSSATQGTDRLIVATDGALGGVVADLTNVSSGQAVNLSAGTYYWQIQAFDGGRSAVWSVIVDVTSQFDVPVASGWNLMGIPYSATDMSTSTLFGAQAAGGVTTFTGQYARPALNQVQHGRGYWVEFPVAGTVSNDVFVRSVIELDLEPRWNMIAGPGCTLSASLITGDTGVIAPGTLFGYDSGAYFLASDYVGGRGYWLFADAAGTITLDCAFAGGGKSAGTDVDLLTEFSSFRLTPGEQATQTLYFGGELPKELSKNAFLLPPLAPSQSWRAEFDTGKFVSADPSVVVRLSGAPFPLVVERGSIDPGDDLRILLLDASGGILEEAAVRAGESFEIIGSGIDRLEVSVISSTSTAAESAELPDVFTLTQNYPNPFNPQTTIRFALPQTDQVTITVLDLTGRIVTTLSRGATYAAGWHEIAFDAGDLASGVYLYRVITKTESKTMRMVLLK